MFLQRKDTWLIFRSIVTSPMAMCDLSTAETFPYLDVTCIAVPSLSDSFLFSFSTVISRVLMFVAVGNPKAERMRYAKQLLQKEFLPHVGIEEWGEAKKAYFFG